MARKGTKKKQVIDLSDTLGTNETSEPDSVSTNSEQATDEPQLYTIPDMDDNDNTLAMDAAIMNNEALMSEQVSEQDYESEQESDPGATQGYPGFTQGNPGATQGYPGFTQGNTGFTQGYPESNQGFDYTHNVHDPNVPSTAPLTNTEDMNSDQESELSSSSSSEPKLTHEEIMRKKVQILTRLQSMYTYPETCQLTMANSLEEMETEYYRMDEQRKLNNAIKTQQRLLLGIAKGIEWGNSKWDPCGLKLDGWSNAVAADMDQYTDIFKEMREKYREKIHISPEVRLVAMFLGSGLMFHISQQAAQKYNSEIPELSEVLKKNPELQKQLVNAAATEAKGKILKNSGLDKLFVKQPEPAPEPKAKVAEPNVTRVQPEVKPFNMDFDDLSVNSLDLWGLCTPLFTLVNTVQPLFNQFHSVCNPSSTICTSEILR